MPATPWPPPTQAVTIPYFLLRRRSSWNNWMDNFAPEQPSGCPNAIAPPLTFTFS